MTQQFRPMKACDATEEDFKELLKRGPLLASCKLDGIRAVVRGGKLLSNTLKPIPNAYIRSILQHPRFEGLDGELIVGESFGEGVFGRSTSGCMSQGGTPDFTWYVFDYHNRPGEPFKYRAHQVLFDWNMPRQEAHVEVLHQRLIKSLDGLLEMEAEALETGYEGLIVRDPDAPYKHGRSTLKQGWMLKLKRFHDSEGVITSLEELMHNDNPQVVNDLGYAKRSAHQENKRPANMLGKFVIDDIHNPDWKNLKVGSGIGLDHDLRKKIWQTPQDYIGKTIKYKYLPVGTKDLPRHPIYLGFRHKEDISC